MRVRLPLLALLALPAFAPLAASTDGGWPGFRGPTGNGLSTETGLPVRWSPTENVRWAVDVPGRGWSSPIVWNGRVYVTSAISGKPFKQPTPGLYGNDYIAELRKQGLPDDEVMRRVQARDNEGPEESDVIRYMVYALDAKTGARGVGTRSAQGAALRRSPSQEHLRVRDAGHRRRAPVRVVRAEHRAVLLLARRHAALEAAVAAHRDLPELRHGQFAGRPRRPRLRAAGQRGGVVCHRARRQDRRRRVAHAAHLRRLPEVVVVHAARLGARTDAPSW